MINEQLDRKHLETLENLVHNELSPRFSGVTNRDYLLGFTINAYYNKRKKNIYRDLRLGKYVNFHYPYVQARDSLLTTIAWYKGKAYNGK